MQKGHRRCRKHFPVNRGGFGVLPSQYVAPAALQPARPAAVDPWQALQAVATVPDYPPIKSGGFPCRRLQPLPPFLVCYRGRVAFLFSVV